MADEDTEPRVLVERRDDKIDTYAYSSRWSLTDENGVVIYDEDGDVVAEYVAGSWLRVWTSYD